MLLRKRPGQDWQPIIGTQFLRYLEEDDKVRLALGEIVAQDVGFGRVWLYMAVDGLFITSTKFYTTFPSDSGSVKVIEFNGGNRIISVGLYGLMVVPE